MRPEARSGFCQDGGDLNQKLFVFFAQNLSSLGPELNKLMQLKRITKRWPRGAEHPVDKRFL